MQYKLLETYSVEYTFKKKEYGKMHLQSPVMIVDLSGVCVCLCGSSSFFCSFGFNWSL